MKTASAALANLLEENQPFIGADLYTIVLFNGTKLYFTSLDRNVIYTDPNYGTQIYLSLGQSATGAPLIQRSRLSMGVGLNPSKVDVEIYSTPQSVLVLNQDLMSTIANGLWSNAFVQIRRAFILPSDLPTNWNTPVPCNLGGTGDGTLLWFAGYVGKITELSPISVKFEVRDLIWYLNRPLPKNLYGPGCYHKLFDLGCGLSPSTFQAGPFPVLSGSTTTAINTGLTNDVGIPGPPVWGSNPIIVHGTVTALAAVTDFVQSTYVISTGETIASAEWSAPLTPNHVIEVSSPPGVSGASFWNCYVGVESGNEQRQNPDPIPIGTSFKQYNSDSSVNPIVANGIIPPPLPTNGWWSLGVITINYKNGLRSGQSVSGFIEQSSNTGVLTLRVPLPQVPVATGATPDTYTVLPGCDLQMTTCQGKFNNLVHFSGYPFVPVPETGF